MTEQRHESLINALDLAVLLLVLVSVSVRPLVCGIGARYTALGLVEAPVVNLLASLPFLFALLLWVSRMALKAELRWVRTGMGIAILFFVIFVVRSVFISAYRWRSAMAALDWIEQILLFFLLVNFLDDEKKRSLVLACLAATAVVVAINGLHQRLIAFPELMHQYGLDPVGTARSAGVAPEDMDDFRSRMETLRIYSTFLLPTTLAGFFVLIIPPQIGLLVDRLKRRRLAAGIGAALFLQMIALFLTKSKGGWITLAIGLLLFTAIWGRSFVWRFKKPIGICLGLFILLFALAQWRGKLPPASRYVDSFYVRAQYWRAGVEMIKDHPFSGIGLDEFGDVYTAYKRPGDDETQMAHNNFIQVWAETGIFGFASFCGIWIVFLVRHLLFGCRHREGTPASRSEPAPARGEMELAVVGIGAGAFATGLAAFQYFSLPLSLGGLLMVLLGWIGAFMLVFSGGNAPGPGTLRGIWIGVVCFLIHSLVDFDLYEPGVAQTLWTLAGVAVASALPRREIVRKLGAPGRLGLAGAGLAAAAAFVLLLWPPILLGGVYLANARAFLEENPPKWNEVVSEFQKSAEYAPRCALPQQWLGILYKGMWEHPGQDFDVASPFTLAVKHLKRAAELNPRRAGYHYELGELYRGGATNKNMQEEALSEYEEAVNYYPVKPLYIAQLAFMYEELKKPKKLIDETFRRALEIDDLSIRRNKLSEEMRKKIEARLKE